jgi:hypothetical protein
MLKKRCCLEVKASQNQTSLPIGKVEKISVKMAVDENTYKIKMWLSLGVLSELILRIIRILIYRGRVYFGSVVLQTLKRNGFASNLFLCLYTYGSSLCIKH